MTTIAGVLGATAAQVTAPTASNVNDWLGSTGTGAYAVITVLLAVNLAFMIYRRLRR